MPGCSVAAAATGGAAAGVRPGAGTRLQRSRERVGVRVGFLARSGARSRAQERRTRPLAMAARSSGGGANRSPAERWPWREKEHGSKGRGGRGSRRVGWSRRRARGRSDGVESSAVVVGSRGRSRRRGRRHGAPGVTWLGDEEEGVAAEPLDGMERGRLDGGHGDRRRWRRPRSGVCERSRQRRGRAFGGERGDSREFFCKKHATSAPDRQAQPVSFRVNTYKQLF